MHQGGWSGETPMQRLTALPYLAAAAALFVATALLTLLSVFWRVLASADEPTLAASLAAIAESRGAYLAAGVTRLAAGATLLVGAWCLGRTGAARGWVAPVLLALSGLLTLLSGASAVVLGAVFAGLDPESGGALARWAAPVEGVRWFAGAGGFAAAGLALIAVAAAPRRRSAVALLLAAATAAVGAAMQLIWIDAAGAVHRVSGIAFVAWLAVAGAGLLAGWGPWRGGDAHAG